MRFRPTALVAAVVLISTILVGTVLVQAQPAPAPSSLVFDLGNLYATTDSKLKNETAKPAAAAACGSALTAPGTSGTGSFELEMLPFNGTMYHAVDEIKLKVVFDSASQSSTGVSVRAKLNVGADPNKAPAEQTKSAAPATPGGVPASQDFTFVTADANGSALVVHNGAKLKVDITYSPLAGPQGAPGAVQRDIKLQCGPQGTRLEAVKLIAGMPGDGDLDGDGLPNPSDTDRDNDGVLNTQENIPCNLDGDATTGTGGKESSMADSRDAKPGTVAQADSDKDGWSDQEECEKGFSPLQSTSAPTRPKTIMEILLPFILILVLVGLVAGIIFAFMKYGKTVTVTIATTSELFIPAGNKAKYEVNVANLAQKGEARTFQLLVAGTPEGWDAKLNTDHVTLDPVGGAQNRSVVWLEVESPNRPEPESAVVTVKAVPLNKAGRKDTLKLPGKAETITSINVPPGSKVPVKRGGKIEAAEPEEGPTTAAGGIPVAQLGLDDAAAKKLAAAGIENSEQLRTAEPGGLHKKTKIPESTLVSWQQVCDLVRLGMTAPQANGLVTGGIPSVGALANADAKDVAGKAGVDEKTGKAWVKAAGKWVKQHPAEAMAAPGAPAAAPPPVAAGAAPAAAGGAKPSLQVGGLKHEPPAFRQGETVKSSVSVTNNGGAASTIKLSLYVNEGLADVQTVTVKAGKAKDVQFKWTAQEKNKLNIRGEVVPG